MIPNVVHFLYFGGKPFSLVHYLAVKSASVVNNPDRISWYCDNEPSGVWWEKAKPFVTVVPMTPPTEIGGRPLLHPAHQADVARLEVLRAHGGIYLDIDVICVRPFTPLLGERFVLGQEAEGGKHGLCNAVILSEREAFFARKWLEGFDPATSHWNGFRSRGRDEHWGEMSVRYPTFLASVHPDEIAIQDYRAFHWPTYSPDHLDWLFRKTGDAFAHAYCHHLWETVSWDRFLRDLTPEYIETVETNFTTIVRRFLLDDRT